MRLKTLVVLLTAPVVGALGGLLALELIGSARADPAPFTDRFRDVAAAQGLTGRHRAVAPCGFNAAGAAWGDVDGDRDLDFFLPRQRGSSRLWIQGPGGGFRDRARRWGVSEAGIATAAAFADYDDDGDQDLYVGGAGEDLLFESSLADARHRSRGPILTPTGALGTGPSGLSPSAPDLEPAMSAAWADFDRDGRLDLHVANGNNCGPEPGPAPNRLYRNLGSGQFEDASRLLPAGPSAGVTLDALWFDYDTDGDQDLYLGNDDLNGHSNALLENDGRGFVDASASSGAGISRFSMGVAAGDVDGDGQPDLAVTDIGRAALLVQRQGVFADEAEQRGFGNERFRDGEESITWGVAAADFDNDRDLDAYAAGGALGLDAGQYPDVLYENQGSGQFDRFDVAAPGSGRTVAPADWDRDGDVDLLVAQLAGRPLLLENRGRPTGRWLELRLVGRRSPRDACGATVSLRVGGDSQWRQVECRTGDHVVHFGLGEARRATEVSIVWPSGRLQRLERLRAQRLHTIREPRGRVRAR